MTSCSWNRHVNCCSASSTGLGQGDYPADSVSCPRKAAVPMPARGGLKRERKPSRFHQFRALQLLCVEDSQVQLAQNLPIKPPGDRWRTTAGVFAGKAAAGGAS